MPEKNQNRGIEFEENASSKNKQGLSYLFGIGINEYLEFPNLNNAVKDIQDFESVLKEKYDLDKVISLFDGDASRDNIIDGFDELKREIGLSDKLIIYFSGHGHIEDEDSGFWIPYDAIQHRTSRYIRNSTIREYIKKIKSKHTLLISDACFSGSLLSGKERSAGQVVFEKLESKTSRWALCSGRHDEKVADGRPGANSPFANSILEILKENQESHLNIAKLADEVVKLTADEYDQLPEGSPVKGVGHRGGEYVFKQKIITEKPEKQEREISEKEKADWEKAIEKGRATAYSHYLRQYSNGHFKEEAKKKLSELEEDSRWKKVKKRIDYIEYLEEYPKGRFVDEANATIHQLDEEDDWEHAKEQNTLESYQEFLEEYPKSIYAKEASKKLVSLDEKLAWEQVQKENKLQSYEEFVLKFPNGKFIKEAETAIDTFKDDLAWNKAKKQNNLNAYKKYLKAQSNGKYIKQAKASVDVFKDDLAWDKTLEQKDLTAFDTYLKTFPKGKHIKEAQKFAAQLGDKEAWEKAKEANNITAFEKYIKAYPSGIFLSQAQNSILELRDERAWKKAAKQDDIDAYESYLKAYPKGKHYREAKRAIVKLKSPLIDVENTRTFSSELLQGHITKPITDKDGNTYTTKLMKDGKIWMTQNLNLKIKGSYTSPKGQFYTLKAAKKAAKMIGDGWRLPTATEWGLLKALYEMPRQSKIQKILGTGQKYNRDLLEGGISGFHATPTDLSNPSDKLKNGYYWASEGEKMRFSLMGDMVNTIPILYYGEEDDIACLVRLIKTNIPK